MAISWSTVSLTDHIRWIAKGTQVSTLPGGGGAAVGCGAVGAAGAGGGDVSASPE